MFVTGDATLLEIVAVAPPIVDGGEPVPASQTHQGGCPAEQATWLQQTTSKGHGLVRIPRLTT